MKVWFTVSGRWDDPRPGKFIEPFDTNDVEAMLAFFATWPDDYVGIVSFDPETGFECFAIGRPELD